MPCLKRLKDVHCRSERGRNLQRVLQLQFTRLEILLDPATLATRLRLADEEEKYSGILIQSALCGQGWYLVVSHCAASATKADIAKPPQAARTSRLQCFVSHLHAPFALRQERLSTNVVFTVQITQNRCMLPLAPRALYQARLLTSAENFY